MPQPLIELLFAGPKHRIYFLADGSHSTPRDLAERLHAAGGLAALLRRQPKLEAKKESPPDWKKLLAPIQRTAMEGLEMTARNPSRVKCFVPPEAHTRGERMEVGEFKGAHHRAFFFREEPPRPEPCTTLIITHIYSDKKRNETPAEELVRFADLRTRYYRWRDSLGAQDAVTALSRCNPRDP